MTLGEAIGRWLAHTNLSASRRQDVIVPGETLDTPVRAFIIEGTGTALTTWEDADGTEVVFPLARGVTHVFSIRKIVSIIGDPDGDVPAVLGIW